MILIISCIELVVFNLKCQAELQSFFDTTGNPTPRVQWLHGETILATLGAGELQPAGSIRSLALSIRNATRSKLANLYTCTADNTLMSPPLRTSVRVDLYCKYL